MCMYRYSNKVVIICHVTLFYLYLKPLSSCILILVILCGFIILFWRKLLLQYGLYVILCVFCRVFLVIFLFLFSQVMKSTRDS